MAKKTILDNTGERMIPEYHNHTLIYAEHIMRYQAATSFIKDKVVLDIASGSGYGTNLLAKEAKYVYGIDVDANSVQYAQEVYSAKNIDFRVGDGESIPLEDNSVDVIITFETIEHIKDYKKFLNEVNRVLRPDGLAIVSTPNDLEFAEGNHFHLHEFQYKELYDLLKKDFKNIDSYYQATWKYVALGGAEIFSREGPLDIQSSNLAPLNAKQYLYFYLICSNRGIKEKIKPVGAMGDHYSDRQQQALAQEKQDILTVLEDTQAGHKKLAAQLTATTNQLKVAQQELETIKSSRAYKAAIKARAIKARFRR